MINPNPPHISPPSKPKSSLLNFNIDTYLNPFVPSRQSVLGNLPAWISWWLGYRSEYSQGPNGERRERKRNPNRLPDVYNWIWAFVGAFCGVAALECVFLLSEEMKRRGAGLIIGSYGAAAILLYNATDTPLAQPRNAFFGQLLSSVLGVGITKLFLLIPHSPSGSTDNPLSTLPRYSWLAAALSCALSSSLMSMTKTVHPPAGATALLAAVDPTIIELGWWYVIIVITSSTVMVAVACILNNVDLGWVLGWWRGRKSVGGVNEGAKTEWGRRWPVYWWVVAGGTGTAYKKLGKLSKRGKGVSKKAEESGMNGEDLGKDLEKGTENPMPALRKALSRTVTPGHEQHSLYLVRAHSHSQSPVEEYATYCPPINPPSPENQTSEYRSKLHKITHPHLRLRSNESAVGTTPSDMSSRAHLQVQSLETIPDIASNSNNSSITISKDSIKLPWYIISSSESPLSEQERLVLMALQRRIKHFEREQKVAATEEVDGGPVGTTKSRGSSSVSASSSQTAVNALSKAGEKNAGGSGALR